LSLEQLVSRHYETEVKGGWTSFHLPSLRPAGFGTSRVGKFQRSGRLLFTVGETQKGKSLDLSRDMARLIQAAGLKVVREASTAGQRRQTAEYLGFETNGIPDQIVERVLVDVRNLIGRNAAD
jgi:hypothetical protein